MSDLESNLSALIAKVSELEKQQTTLKKYVVKLKHTLDEQIENFYHRPEIQTVESLQEKLTTLSLRLDELFTINNPIKSTPVQDILSEEISQNPQEYENQLVFDRSGSRRVLIEALATVESRLIIVCPWLNCNGIDENLVEKFKGCLGRGCQVDIGWGYLGDRSNIGKGWKYNALVDLQELEQGYPDLLSLKLLGTHENFLVCDEKFAFVGSHNFLASGEESWEREVGIRTTDIKIIQGLIEHFDNAEVLESAEIDCRFAASVKSLDEVEYLSGVIDENEMEFRDFSMVVDEDEEEEELEELEEEEESQEPVVSAEEFLRRYNEGERDFIGINLSGADLSGKSFDSKLNLSNANFNGANLSGSSLQSVDLTGAKFRDTNLCETNFRAANLSQARFINSNLNKAQMNSVKLEKAKFRNVNLSEASLQCANFTEAKLNGVNLTNSDLQFANFTEAKLNEVNFSSSKLLNYANFSNANLTKANLNGLNLSNANFNSANLSQADLSRANLLKANLKGANLQMVKMNQALCTEVNGFPKEFDYKKLGVYFLAPNTSLRGVNLSGTDLRQVNLSGADLRKVNFDRTNLNGADLRLANLSESSLKDANLVRAILITTDLTKADLRNAELIGANLRGADLILADLRAAKPRDADLSGANLTDAKLGGVFWQNTKLTGAIMPDGSVHE